MPIMVIDQQTDLAGLARRLLKPRTSKAATERAIRAIREANPGVDLDELVAGSVVVVPVLPESRRAGAAGLEDDVAGHVLHRLSTALEATVAAADAALQADGAERDAMREILSSAEVKHASGRDEGIRKLVGELQASLKEDDGADRQRVDALHEATASWAEGLAELRGLVQPPG